MDDQNCSPSAHLILDKPLLVDERVDVYIASGQTYREALNRHIIKSELAYVVLVDGLVVDQNETIEPDTEIRCVPQIVGG